MARMLRSRDKPLKGCIDRRRVLSYARRMAKKPSGLKSSGGASVHASRSPDATTARDDARPTPRQKPSALVDTRVIYCGDNLEQLKKLPDACIDLIYIDPPFNSNRNYEVFLGQDQGEARLRGPPRQHASLH